MKVFLGCFALATVGIACESAVTPPEPVRVETLRHCDHAPFTDAVVAKANLDAIIESELERFELGAGADWSHQRLFDHLATRVRFFGTYDDFHKMEAVAAELPNDLARRRRMSMAVHRFEDANRSEAGGEDQAMLNDAAHALAVGEPLDEHVSTVGALAARSRSFGIWQLLGHLRAATGDFEGADEAYCGAIDVYRDVAPFAHAEIAFRRGLMWSEMAGDDVKGRALYARAVEILPTYVVANTHLAELELDAGDEVAARDRWRGFADSGDPEPAGKLAASLRDPALRAQARNRYEILLAAFPAAFADHASEFFRDVDPERAMALADLNLETRQDSRAYLVALEAAETLGDRARVCALAHDANVIPHPTPVLHAKLEVSDCL